MPPQFETGPPTGSPDGEGLAVPGRPGLVFEMPFAYQGTNRHIWAAHDRMFAWLSDYGLLPRPSNVSVLKGSRCDLLTGCYYPRTDLPTLELLDQFMGWGFVIDDQIDDGTCGLDPERTAAVIAELVSILRDDPPATTSPAGAALADWWRRIGEICTGSWRRQFTNSTDLWLNTYALETRQWAAGHLPTMREYLTYRGHAIGSWTYSDLCEIANHAELPEAVRRLPAYQKMRTPMALHVGLANDVLSHDKESRLGREVDAVTILTTRRGYSETEALAEVVSMVNGYLHDFLAAERDFHRQLQDAGFAPSTQRTAHQTVQSLRTHIRASTEWAVLAVERFGDDSTYLRGSDPTVHDVLTHPAGHQQTLSLRGDLSRRRDHNGHAISLRLKEDWFLGCGGRPCSSAPMASCPSGRPASSV